MDEQSERCHADEVADEEPEYQHVSPILRYGSSDKGPESLGLGCPGVSLCLQLREPCVEYVHALLAFECNVRKLLHATYMLLRGSLAHDSRTVIGDDSEANFACLRGAIELALRSFAIVHAQVVPRRRGVGVFAHVYPCLSDWIHSVLRSGPLAELPELIPRGSWYAFIGLYVTPIPKFGGMV